jgi:hypothetical protein
MVQSPEHKDDESYDDCQHPHCPNKKMIDMRPIDKFPGIHPTPRVIDFDLVAECGLGIALAASPREW